MSQFRPAKRRKSVSVGESVRIIREIQDLSQNQLAACIAWAQDPAATAADAWLASPSPKRRAARQAKGHPAA